MTKNNLKLITYHGYTICCFGFRLERSSSKFGSVGCWDPSDATHELRHMSLFVNIIESMRNVQCKKYHIRIPVYIFIYRISYIIIFMFHLFMFIYFIFRFIISISYAYHIHIIFFSRLFQIFPKKMQLRTAAQGAPTANIQDVQLPPAGFRQKCDSSE